MTFALPDIQFLYVPRPGRLSAFFRSRMRSLDIQLDTVTTILASYGLELTATPRNLPNARRNRNLIVQTNQGKKILKLYRSDWLSDTIIFEHSILHQLGHLNASAPRLLRTRNGQSYITFENDNYALFDFIEGKTYTSSFLLRAHRLKLMALSGQTLARLHQQLQGFQPQQQHHLGFGDYHGRRHRDLTWHINKVDELIAASRHLADEAEEATLADRLMRQSDIVLSQLSQLDEQLNLLNLPRLVIHGDYGLHNLLFQSKTEATPIDFELARLEWRLCDLVSCLSKLRYGQGNYDFESITAFMNGYQREFPIDDEEWQYFPQVWQFYRLMGAVQYWKSYFDTNGPIRKLHSALDSIEQANWAVNNSEKILAINPNWRGLQNAKVVV